VSFSRLRSMEAVNAALTHLTASPRATKDASPAPNVLTNFPDVLFLFVAGINFPAPQTEISVCYRIRAICPTLEIINVD